VPRTPLLPGCQDHGQHLKFDLGASQWAHDRAAGELVPERSGLPVIHQLVRAIEKARLTKGEWLAAPGDAAVEQNPGATQGAIGEAHRPAADNVVHHLMPIHDTQRIGARVVTDLDTEDPVIRIEIAGLRGRCPAIRGKPFTKCELPHTSHPILERYCLRVGGSGRSSR
jgi:hypothetical protein